MTITPISIPNFLSSLIVGYLGLFVIIKNPKSKNHWTFFLTTTSIFTWLFFYSIAYNSSTENAEFLFRIGAIGVTFIAPLILIHYVAMSESNASRIGKLFSLPYLISAFFFAFFILKTNFIINGLYHYPWGNYLKGQNLYLLYVTWFLFCTTLAFFILLWEFKKTPYGHKKQRMKWQVFAFLMLSLSSVDFLPKFGINFVPFGWLTVLLYTGITTFAIIKHKLLDINLFIKRSILYTTAISSITLLYFIIVILLERISQNLIGYKSISISMTAALTIAILFTPIKNWIQKLIDTLLLAGTPTELADQNRILKDEAARAQRLEAVSILASGLAHEIRNPLTAIKTFAEYLPKKKNDPEFLNQFSTIVSRETDRINSLVQQLLDFSKPSAPALEEHDIRKIIHETLDLLNSRLIQANITLKNSIPKAEPHLALLDANQIRQALLNILMNAIEAMPKDGHLTIDDEIGAGNLYRITISDTGCGISEEDLKHLFDPFYTKKDGGTGLGLSITHNIIKEHNGKILVASKLGVGTTFIIELEKSA